MKKWIFTTRLRVLLIAGMSAVSISYTSVAWAGASSGGGGDAYALEFTAIARYLVTDLENWAPSRMILTSPQLLMVRKAIDQVRIVTLDHVFLIGAEVDAVNHPSEKVIELNRSRWDQLKGREQLDMKLALVFHEYMSVVGIPDSRYRFSSDFFKRAKAQTACNYGEDAMSKARQCLERIAKKEFGGNVADSSSGGTMFSRTSADNDLFLVQLNYDTLSLIPGQYSVTGVLECDRDGVLRVNSLSYFLPNGYGVRGSHDHCD
jgi:hypothetical protein